MIKHFRDKVNRKRERPQTGFMDEEDVKVT